VRWLGAWIAGIAALAVAGRPIADALRGAGALTAVVAGLGVAAAAGLLRAVDRADRPALAATALAAAGWGMHWPLAEERLHLVQYLPLGWLAVRALGARGLAAALAVGVADEALQGALPTRVFDVWDVLANGLAATAGAALAAGGKRAWMAPAVLLGAALLFAVAHAPAGGDRANPAAAIPRESPPAPPAPTASTSPATPRSPGGFAPSVASTPSATTPSPGAAYPDASILLVTVDALRADAVAPWGTPCTPLPAFERLARESLAAERAVANSLWTTPSILALLTGLHPVRHGVFARGQELAGPTPIDELRAASWTTTGFSRADDETYRGLRFDRAIDRVDPIGSALDSVEAERSFTWLHLRNVHAPYDATFAQLADLGLPTSLPDSPILDRARTAPTVPRADYPGDHRWLQPPLRALYAAEVADADHALGRLLAGLDRRNLTDRVVLVVTADHGEELLERGGVGHASTTLDSDAWPELVEIPWFIRLPDGRGANTRLQATVEQVDFIPTVAGLVGGSFGSLAVDGRSHAPAILGGPSASPRVPLVASTPCGWQCSELRRGERVYGLADPADWLTCRPPDCPDVVLDRINAVTPERATPPATPPPPSR